MTITLSLDDLSYHSCGEKNDVLSDILFYQKKRAKIKVDIVFHRLIENRSPVFVVVGFAIGLDEGGSSMLLVRYYYGRQ